MKNVHTSMRGENNRWTLILLPLVSLSFLLVSCLTYHWSEFSQTVHVDRSFSNDIDFVIEIEMNPLSSRAILDVGTDIID